MAGLEHLRKKLAPLWQATEQIDSSASYKVTDGGTLVVSRATGEYNFNQDGLSTKKPPSSGGGPDAMDTAGERMYKISSQEVVVFNTIGFGASSVVRKAIHVPTHRILALKKINVFDREKRQQLLNEIRMLCDAPRAQGLVEFFGAFYTPESGQISIALEYMDGGSLADICRMKKSIPEPILSVVTRRVLQGLDFLHRKQHMVHRDIKPANLLVSLAGDPKITDFGISAGLDNSIAMCATFVGTVTYMSPERINNQMYSYPADVWSLGLALHEMATGEFPYNANKGPVHLMMEVMENASPSPPAEHFSPEFRSFVDNCLLKDPERRPTAEQLLQHPFILRYADAPATLVGQFITDIFDPTERLKDLSDMLTVHYYLLFDGQDTMWEHMRTLYHPHSELMYRSERYTGDANIFACLSTVREGLRNTGTGERLVHTVESLQCRASPSGRGVMVKVSGDIVVGNSFVPPGDCVQVEGASSRGSEAARGPRRGSFSEFFLFEQSEEVTGCFCIEKHELHHIMPLPF